MQLVRDEDHRAPVGRHRPQRLEQRARLLRRQHGGRLVEDQDPGLAVERLEDLDPLLLADGELPDPGARIDGHPVALAELRHPLLDRTRVETERPPHVALVPQHHVLGHRERLDEAEVLVHHADPGRDPVPRGVEGDRSPVDLQLAFVCAVEAGEDVREGALAGAVLAEQGVNLTPERLEVDAVVGNDSRESLRDPAARDCGARTSARRGVRVRLGRGLHTEGRHIAGERRTAPPLSTAQPFALPMTPLTSQFIV